MSKKLDIQMESMVSTYYYQQALDACRHLSAPSEDLLYCLEMLTQRRQLKLDLVYQSGKMSHFVETYGFHLWENKDLEKERLANYLLDLEAKVRVGDLIDFCRAVSPLIYRIFLAMIEQKIPTIKDYIHNAKDHSYDRWKFDLLQASQDPVFEKFLSTSHHQTIVHSSSLLDMIECLDYPEEVLRAARELRYFEKAIRNPLAHLIKPFDEATLAESTGFSSQKFLEDFAYLLSIIGVSYSQRGYYFDQINQQVLYPLLEELAEKVWK